MATDRRFLPAHLEADATWRAWAQGVHAQIVAMGLVQTADTGQVDLSTATRPAVNTMAGYRIYRFADALQATKPVFIRLEYGLGSATQPSLRVSVGTGTTGAGVLTGNVVAPVTYGPTATKTIGVTLESLCAGSTSRLSLITNLDPAVANFAIALLIERTLDGDGTPNGNGVIVHASGASVTNFQMLPFSGAMTAVSGNSPWPLAATAQQYSDGVNVALVPLPVAVAGRVSLASYLRYVHTDIGELTAFSVTHLGAARTMMPMGDAGAPNPATFIGSTTHSIALLWE